MSVFNESVTLKEQNIDEDEGFEDIYDFGYENGS